MMEESDQFPGHTLKDEGLEKRHWEYWVTHQLLTRVWVRLWVTAQYWNSHVYTSGQDLNSLYNALHKYSPLKSTSLGIYVMNQQKHVPNFEVYGNIYIVCKILYK